LAEPRDYYEVLGVSRDAEAKAIKDAFRQLALKYHPDRNKEPGASDRFKEIAEAYAVLSDPKKRAEYDARGIAGVAGFSPEDLFAGINFQDIFGDLGFDTGGASLFNRLFRRRAAPRQGANLEVDVAIPLERVLTGGKKPCTSAGPRRARPVKVRVRSQAPSRGGAQNATEAAGSCGANARAASACGR
jgi:molecular chaperone DnaJ